MPRIMTLVLILFSCWTAATAAVLDNPDRPLQGEVRPAWQKVWSVTGAPDTPFGRIMAIRVDDNGEIFVLDAQANKVLVFSAAGAFITSFGRTGEGPGEVKHFLNMNIAGKYLVINDFDKLHFFDKRGKFVRSVALPNYNLSRVSFLDENRIIAVPASAYTPGGEARLVLYDIVSKKETPLHTFRSSKAGISKSEGGTVMVINPTFVPQMVTAVERGTILLGYSGAYGLRVMDALGKEKLAFSLRRANRAASYESRAGQYRGLKMNGAAMPKEMVDQIVKSLPDTYCAFTDLFIDGAGRYCVATPHDDSGRFLLFDVFSPDGRYLCKMRVDAPAGMKFLGRFQIKGGFLYTAMEDEEGELYLVKSALALPRG